MYLHVSCNALLSLSFFQDEGHCVPDECAPSREFVLCYDFYYDP
jgi:hypothetical protein